MRTLLATSILAALFLSDARAGDLHVGPAGSGAPFTSIQLAIGAAQPGDRVVVAAGDYAENLWVTKPIELVGAGSGATRVQATIFLPEYPEYLGSPLTVSGINAGERVRVAGFEFRVEAPSVKGLITHLVGVLDCDGLVELVDVACAPSNVPGYLPGTDVGYLVVRNSAQVVATRVRADGSAGTFTFMGSPSYGMTHQGFHGALVMNSLVWFERCEFSGLRGKDGGDGIRAVDSEVHLGRAVLVGGYSLQVPGAGPGGSGLRAEGSVVTIHGGSGNSATGADAQAPALFALPKGHAGHGVMLDATSTLVHAEDALFTGGASADAAFPTPLPAGSALVVDPGSTATPLGRRLPTIAFEPALGAPGTPLTLDFEGEPNTVLWGALALETAPSLTLVDHTGALLVYQGALVHLSPLALDGTGHAAFATVIPPMTGLTLVVQVLQLSAEHLDFSPPTLLTITE